MMNPNYGYQLYQAQRVPTRREMIADGTRRGHHAATFTRHLRHLTRRPQPRRPQPRRTPVTVTGPAPHHA